MTRKMGRELKENYAYATADVGRFHKEYAVTAKNMKQELQGLIGDALKTRILFDFKSSLYDNTAPTSSKALKDKVKEFKETPEYRILEKGQGVMTRAFGKLGLKTAASVKAFEAIVNDKKDKLKNPEQMSKAKSHP